MVKTTVGLVKDTFLAQQLSAIPGVSVDSTTTLADVTTLRLGGRPRLTARCSTLAGAREAILLVDASETPLLIVGGGSNLVVADGELDVVAVVLEHDSVDFSADGLVEAEAGAVWDDVVAGAVARGLSGIESLSGIPGSAGATPVQNVGAYGAEISEVLTEVLLLDRASGEVAWQPASSLDLAYRYSNLKFTNRAVVLALRLQLGTDGMSRPRRGSEAQPVAQVREEVLAIRATKGMVLDPDDHDTWSAGSFFTNPVVDAETVERVREVSGASDVPVWDAPGGFKLSAAWLIERAGFPRGYPGPEAPVRLSTKHTLALTNRGSANSQDLVLLAREVREGVRQRFGVTLVPEPVWIGISIDQ